MAKNSFGAAAKLRAGNAEYDFFRLARLEEQGLGSVARLPFSTRILLENLLRNEDGKRVCAADIELVARGEGAGVKEISFLVNIILVGVVWWCANRLTWDCTNVDEDVDMSGEGLLQAAGLEEAAVPPPEPAPEVEAGGMYHVAPGPQAEEISPGPEGRAAEILAAQVLLGRRHGRWR